MDSKAEVLDKMTHRQRQFMDEFCKSCRRDYLEAKSKLISLKAHDLVMEEDDHMVYGYMLLVKDYWEARLAAAARYLSKEDIEKLMKEGE